MPGRALPILVVLVAIGVVVAALYAASGGVRGSDQYWYLADVQTLIERGGNATNVRFPVALFEAGSDPVAAFVHNVLSLYLAAIPALVLGSYFGWIALNVGAALATAALIYLAARRVAEPRVALVCGLGFPLLPLVFWHIPQPLSEVSAALLAAVAISIIARAGTATRPWLLLAVVLGLLYLSRSSYVVLLLAAPIGLFWLRASEQPGRWRDALGPAAAVGAIGLAFVAFGQTVVAEQVERSLGRLLHTSVPGRTDNMWFNFDLSAANVQDQLPFDLSIIPIKLVDNLALQFIRFESVPLAVFFWTFNILAAIAVVSLWRHRRDRARTVITVAALLPVLVHLLTIAWFQNQVRYVLPAVPGLLVVLAIALSGIRPLADLVRRHAAVVVGGMGLAFVGIAFVLGSTIIDEGRRNAAMEDEARSTFERLVDDDQTTLVAYLGGDQLLFGYAARPRPVVYVRPEYDPAELERIEGAVSPAWLLAPIDSTIVDRLAVDAEPAAVLDAFDEAWGLYRLSAGAPIGLPTSDDGAGA